MEVREVRPLVFGRPDVIRVFEELVAADFGPPMHRYLNEMLERLRADKHPYCNTPGLYMSMHGALGIFGNRAPVAVINAIPRILDMVKNLEPALPNVH